MLQKESAYTSDVLTLFVYILRITFKNKCENEDDFDLLLNGPNFMRNGIIIPMLLMKIKVCYKFLTRRCIYQLKKCEHKSVNESIDSDDRNFSLVGLAE